MRWPQIVMIVLYTLSVGVEIERHGELKTGKHSVWNAILGSAIAIWVLWAGGFWK